MDGFRPCPPSLVVDCLRSFYFYLIDTRGLPASGFPPLGWQVETVPTRRDPQIRLAAGRGSAQPAQALVTSAERVAFIALRADCGARWVA